MGLFKKIAHIGENAVKTFSPEDDNQSTSSGNGINSSATPTGISNQLLFDIMTRQFTHDLLHESFEGRMLYPMAFRILMHPADYEDRKDALILILSGVVAKFYKIIQANSANFTNYVPVSRKWFFQFMPCEGNVLMADASDDYVVSRGNPVVLAQLYNTEIDFEASNITTETNVKVSIVCKNSEVGQSNLNLEAIGRIDVLDEGIFTVPFDYALPQDSQLVERSVTQRGVPKSNPISYPEQPGSQSSAPIQQPTSPAGPLPPTPPVWGPATPVQQGYATLVYQTGSNKVTYTMLDTYITISGSSDTRNSRQIFKINTPNIMKDHVLIKYRPDNGNFEIAALGKTRLNSRELELSRGTMRWFLLANNSRIFINDEVSVTFKHIK